VSTLLHATVYMFLHNFLNVLLQIANKIGLQKTIANARYQRDQTVERNYNKESVQMNISY
jgi:hypothetical protein